MKFRLQFIIPPQKKNAAIFEEFDMNPVENKSVKGLKN